MPTSFQSLGIDRLPVEERINLVREIWDSIAAEGRTLATEAQRRELERRADEDDAHPDDVVPWEEVRDRTRTRFRP